MSGAEVIAVLGVISSIISIVDGTKKVYDAATNPQGLPGAFREVAGRLSIVGNILESAKQNIEKGNANSDSCKGVKDTVEACEGKARKLKELFNKAIPADGVSDLKRYCKAVKALGKGSEVESLMKGMLEDVQLLACEGGMKTATKAQQKQIAEAIMAISALSPSVPEHEFQEAGFTNTNSGSGTQNNAQGEYIAQSTARQYNSGGGSQSFAQTNINASFSNSLGPSQDEADACLRALFLTDPRDDRANLITTKGSRVDGTCEWIKSHTLYKSWLRSHSQLLWLSGGPGKGKTMLSIFLAEKLERTPNKLFLQYFCDNKEDKRNTAVTILRGLISQLLNLRRKLFDHILPKFRVQKEHFFSFETLWRIFESMVCDPALETTYCVLDGVDECDEASLEILLGKFATLLSAKTDESSACHLNLLIVSRDVPDSIPCLLSSFPRISLDPDADAEIDKDINLFIKAKVEELSRYRQYPKALRVYVEKVFRERAQGTFLWIGIAAQALRKYKATEVEKALDLFPQGLDKLYARMLLQIDDSRREIAARILRWVVMAVRPLTLSQLSTAIQTTVEPSNVLFDRDEKIRDQVSYCGCFVVVNKDVVSLIHQSAKDYLLRKTWDSNPELEAFRVEEKVANLEIAKRCLDYLQSGALENSKDDVLEDTRHLSSYPLLSYATLHWHEHARSLARSADIFDLSLPFYHPDSQIRRSWWEAYLFWKRKRPSDKDRSWVNPPKDLPLLHLASHLGILPLVQNLVLTEGRTTRGDSFFLLSKADSHGMTALMRAAENGHEAIAQLLLEKGADIQTQDLFGQTAMTRTATRGHEAVVRLLLENGANVNAKDKFGKTALMRAAACGYETVTRLLLENGANFNAENRNRETALIEAVNYEHTAVIQLLLEKGCNMEVRGFNDETALMKAAANETVTRLLLENGANVNAKDAFGRTALMKAAAYGNETVTRLLLKNGANVNAKDEIGRTALMKAAACGYETVTRLLLKNGANLNAEKRNGETALMRAAEYGYETITRLLLENGANVNAENNDGETALMKAAACGYETITRLLLENGANLNAEKRNGETALMKAAEYGHETVTRLLLENGANVNAENNDGETALMRAAEYGYETIIRLLLEKGANVNAKKRNGETALIEAVEYRYTAIIQLLLEKGANINAENNDGETALMRAAVYRNETVTRLLLKNGANVNAKDEIGRTALMIAAASGYETVTRLLLKNGADIDAEDRNGDTALMMAAEHIFKDWREPIVRLLLKNGANVNARNQYAQTALSKAILYGHENAVQLLLEKGAVMEDTEA